VNWHIRPQEGARVEQLLLDLMRRLEAIGDRDESLYDTVVREKMGDPVFHLFIKPKAGYLMPDDYGMSDEDNRAIKAALCEYIDRALTLAPKVGLDTFHKRLAAFQDLEVRTEQANYYDDFFGWSNPEQFDCEGNVIRRE
jgi:hypothetical protein